MSERTAPLTQRAHAALGSVLGPGDVAVDATAGNGHDTLFLAGRVAPTGRIHAFDVQPAALAATRARLAKAGMEDRVTLHQAGHERMPEVLPESVAGRVRAVVFNLGYLPGSGDKAVTTLPATTARGLAAARTILAPEGLISVLVYRGHPGGPAEAEAVRVWLGRCAAAGDRVESYDSPGPILHLVCRSPEPAGAHSPASGDRPRK